jgi:hypothetical protein
VYVPLSLANNSISGFASLAARDVWLQMTRQENRVYRSSRIFCVEEGDTEPEVRMSVALSAAWMKRPCESRTSRSVSGAGWCEVSRNGAAIAVVGTGA